MNIIRTREYYNSVTEEDLCSCDSCRNFRKQIRACYPKIAQYLEDLGAEIEKTHETWSVETDAQGGLLYPEAQYIIFGNRDEFEPAEICDVKITPAQSYPYTGIEEEHFVIEAGPFSLKMDH